MTISPSPSAHDGPQHRDAVLTPLERFAPLYLISNTSKGRAVYASVPIPAGTTIDTCPVLVLDPDENTQHVAKTSLFHYTYNWPIAHPVARAEAGTTPQQQTHNATQTKTQAVVFGLGSMFNHSTHRQNVGWTRDLQREVVVYRTLRDIPAGEELCISYGDRLTFVDADADASEARESVEGAEDVLGRIELGSDLD